MIERHIDINRFDYDLPDGRIAKFPLAERSSSKLLVYRGGEISEAHYADMGDVLPAGQLLVFNNTKVIRARIIMLSRAARPGRLRAGVRRHGNLPMVVHRGQPQEMEGGLCGDQFRA